MAASEGLVVFKQATIACLQTSQQSTFTLDLYVFTFLLIQLDL